MKALVSEQAAIAVVIDDNAVYSIHLDSSERVARSLSDVPHLLADATDVIELADTTPKKVANALETAWKQDRALYLILVLLDRGADEDARRMAAECLEDLLKHPEVEDHVCNRLYSAPLPASADLLGSLLIAESKRAGRVSDLIEDLGETQAEVALRRSEWDALPPELFGGERQKLEFGYELVVSGAFRRASRSAGTERNQALIDALADNRIKSMPRSRDILMRWIKPIRVKFEAVREFEDEEGGPRRDRQRGLHGTGQKPKRSHVVFESITRQKDAIKQAMDNGRSDIVLRYTDQLVAYQLRRSELSDTVRSLCDLAMYAKECGAYEIQLALTRKAVEIVPTDAWSLAQLADAYLAVGRHEDALQAYDRAGSCGESAISRTGRAGVLKAQGRLDEALREYETAAREFPHDVVARNGRAEVLKAQGRLDEALREYETAVRDFPHDVVARTGRAEVLKAQGRLDEALREYETVASDFPHDVVPRNGRAEVLKAQGRLDEALREYETVMRDYPRNAVARNGRAEVLKAQGRLDESLREYETAVRDFPHDVVARNGRAEVLKAQGKLDEALREYETTVRDFPQNTVARNGRAEVLKAQGRLDEALREYETAVRDFPHDAVARDGRAEVLKAQGRLDDALREYEATARDFPRNVVARTGRAEVLKAQGRLDEALREYETAVRDFPHNVVARTGRAEVLKAQGRLDEALREYETTVRDFPHNVVALNGRAEVLKAQGRLDKALAEYEMVRHRFPESRVTRNGYASVLIMRERYAEALKILSSRSSGTLDDFIDYHMRGLVFLKTGDVERAVQIFESGLADSPWHETQGYFRRALALARLQLKQYTAAVEVLANESTPSVEILRIDAFGRLGYTSRARAAMEKIKNNTLPVLVLLRDELSARYLAQSIQRTHSDTWLFERECDLLLAA